MALMYPMEASQESVDGEDEASLGAVRAAGEAAKRSITSAGDTVTLCRSVWPEPGFSTSVQAPQQHACTLGNLALDLERWKVGDSAPSMLGLAMTPASELVGG